MLLIWGLERFPSRVRFYFLLVKCGSRNAFSHSDHKKYFRRRGSNSLHGLMERFEMGECCFGDRHALVICSHFDDVGFYVVNLHVDDRSLWHREIPISGCHLKCIDHHDSEFNHLPLFIGGSPPERNHRVVGWRRLRKFLSNHREESSGGHPQQSVIWLFDSTST